MISTRDKEVRRVGACFTAASLLEVCIYPSPGLVSPRDKGGHSDMSLLTFMLGSSALAPYFTEFAAIGWEQAQRSLPDVFAELRHAGILAEADLLEATDGVNTQRGQLFLLGLAAGITGVCLRLGHKVPSPEFYAAVSEACLDLSSRDLHSLTMDRARTTGERLFLQHRATGVRGEAEAGFPAVQQWGYPALQEGLKSGLSLNDAGVHSLITIMAGLQDTTVLGRLGLDGLKLMHSTAKDILSAGSVFSTSGRDKILEAHHSFSSIGLSPGGAADLLALSMALYFIEYDFPGKELLLADSLFDLDYNGHATCNSFLDRS